jgi:diguanylate cyclase (GGDEF)-like protein/PAS domain S-box-containing protein
MQLPDQFSRSIIENMINGFAFHRIITDDSGKPTDYRYIDVNTAFEEYTGLKRENIIGRTIREIAPDIDKDPINWIDFFGKVAVEGGRDSVEQYSAVFDRWYSVNAYSPEKGYFVAIFNDITRIKKSEEKLLEQNEKLSALYDEQTALYEELMASEEELRQQNDELVESNRRATENERRLNKAQRLAKVGNWELDLVERTMWGSEEAFRLYGLERKSPYMPLPVVQGMVCEEDREKLDEALQNLITKNIPYDVKFKILRHDGEERYMHSIAELEADRHGKPLRVLGAIQDITVIVRHEQELRERNEELSTLYEELSASEEELKDNFLRLSLSMEENRKQQERLEHLAYHDVLTNLPNRTLFMDRLNIALGMSERTGQQTAVIFMDIDNFKDVNDTLGHNIGDKLLKAVSGRLSQHIRKYETLARLGGDEFALLIQNINSEEEIYEFCERVRTGLAKPFEFDGYLFHINASIGISLYPGDGVTAEELLKNADTAMYCAKNLGKNNVQFFQEKMKQGILRKMAIEKSLRKALNTSGFELYYQPQLCISTGKVRAFEALLRWKDPELGSVSPLEFIPIAEDTGLIVPLGEWVLREACRQGAEWNRTCCKDLMVSVNISTVQLKQANFVQMVSEILHETGFLPTHLELEVTESLLINSFEQAVAMLKGLRDMGIKISMDDFGTGYSSLNYLRRLPLNTLKIDKSFIQDIDVQSMGENIVNSIVSLVHGLQIEVVAEGVETEAQLDYLIRCNCDSIQGYLISKPGPAGNAMSIMQKNYGGIVGVHPAE